jgi:hypothetical protein
MDLEKMDAARMHNEFASAGREIEEYRAAVAATAAGLQARVARLEGSWRACARACGRRPEPRARRTSRLQQQTPCSMARSK